MSHILYIFVTSERPDQYINSIAHCLLVDGVRKVVFINIKSFGETNSTNNNSNDGLSLVALRHVTVLLDSLSNGKYRYFIDSKVDTTVNLDQYYSDTDITSVKSIYKQILDLKTSWEHKEINYLELRKELAKLQNSEDKPILDVTAIKKAYLGDLVACCLLEKIESLYTFDLKISPTYETPWKSLFHELKKDTKQNCLYTYINIVDTAVYKDCLKSVLVNTTPVKVVLLITTILILALIVISYYFQHLTWIIQIVSIISAVASIVSLYLVFFPPRRL